MNWNQLRISSETKSCSAPLGLCSWFGVADEAKHSSHITPEAIVLTGDEEDPVLARVISLSTRPNGIKVHLQILPGDPLSYIDTLRHTHLLAS
jgi:hypothetical protein